MASPHGNFDELWSEAVDTFQQRSGQKLKKIYLPSLKSVQDLVDLTDATHKKYKDYDEKGKMLRDVLIVVLTPIELLGDIANAAVSAFYPPAAAIFAAVKYLIDSAKGTGQCYSTIIELLESLKHIGCRLRLYSEHLMPLMLEHVVIEILATFLEIFAISAKCLNSGRLKTFFSIALLKDDRGVQGARDRLLKLTDLEQSTLSASIWVALQKEMLRTANTNEKLYRLVNYFGVDELSDVRKVLLPNTSGSHYISHNIYNEHSVSLISGTGAWVQQRPEFQSWISKKRHLLWIYGETGVGKSYLTYNIIQFLQQYMANKERRIPVAYFFVKVGVPESISINTLIREISCQIAENDEDYAAYIRQQGTRLDSVQSTPELMGKLFKNYFANRKKSSTYFIIYGLQNLPRRERNAIARLACQLKPAFSTLFVTTFTPQILKDWSKYFDIRRHTIEILPELTKDDVNKYIERSLKDITISQTTRAAYDEVRDTLSENAGGNFLWVDEMVKKLNLCVTPNDRKRVLRDAANTWNQLFAKSLSDLAESLSEPYLELLKDIIPWVALAFPPLSVRALSQALEIRGAEGENVPGLRGYLESTYGLIFDLKTRQGSRPMLVVDALDPDEELERIREDLPMLEMALDPKLTFPNDGDQAEDDDSIYLVFRHEKVRGVLETSTCGIRFDASTAPAKIIRTCLEIFCDDRKYGTCKDDLTYSASHLDHYLGLLNIRSLAVEDRCAIAELFALLFSDTSCLSRWVDRAGGCLNERYLGCDVYSKSLRVLLDDDSVKAHLDKKGEIGDWARRFLSDPFQTMFENIVKICGQRWLDGAISSVTREILFLYSYLRKKQDQQFHPQTTITKLQPEEIIQTAISIGFNAESGQHNLRVANALLKAGHTKRVVQFAKSATEKAPENGKAFLSLGLALFADGRRREAHEQLFKAQELLADTGMEQRMATFEVLYQCGESAANLEHAVMGFSAHDKSTWILEHRMDLFLRSNDYERVTQVLQLVIQPPPSPRQWEKFFWEFSRHIPHHQRLLRYTAATKQKNRQLVTSLYTCGLNTLARCHVGGAKSVFRYLYALLCLRLGFNEGRALELLSLAVDELSSEKIESAYEKIKYGAEIDLHVEYLKKGLVSKSRQFKEGEKYKRHFVELARKLSATSCEKDLISALPLAVWCREKQNPNCSAEPFIWKFVRHSIGLVRGLDRQGCMSGWYLLSDALTACGDKHNATAALCFVKQTRLSNAANEPVDAPVSFENMTSEESESKSRVTVESDGTSAELEHYSGVYGGFSCEACGKFIMANMRHYRCTVCVTVDLCRSCYRGLKGGCLPLNVCGATHDFLSIPPMRVAYAHGKMHIADDSDALVETTVQAWLDCIAAKVCIENKSNDSLKED